MKKHAFFGIFCALFLFAGCSDKNPAGTGNPQDLSDVPLIGKWRTIPDGDTMVILKDGTLSDGRKVVPNMYWVGDSEWVIRYGTDRDTIAGSPFEARHCTGGLYKIANDTFFIKEDGAVFYKETPGIYGTWIHFRYEGSVSSEASFRYEIKQIYTVEANGDVFLKVDTTSVNRATGAQQVMKGQNLLYATVRNVTGSTFDYTENSETSNLTYKNMAGFMILVESDAPYEKAMVRIP